MTTDKSIMRIDEFTTIVGGSKVQAYPAQPGHSLATGLNSVNATNLLYGY